MRTVTALLLALCLAGCVPGHTYPPGEANQPLPVRFYGGHVVSVARAALGYPYAEIGVAAVRAPLRAVGAIVAQGPQPAGGIAGVAWGGGAVGLSVQAPAGALEYTVSLDGTGQLIQVTQYVLPEDCQLTVGCAIQPTQPVVLRVTAAREARILPLALVPANFAAEVRRGEPLLLPLGIETRLASPPRALCFGLAAHCAPVYPVRPE